MLETTLEKVVQSSHKATGGAVAYTLVLCLEAFHIFLFLLTSANSVGLIHLVLESVLWDRAVLVISGFVSGVADYCLFHRRSRAISDIGAGVVLGSVIAAASGMVEPSPLGTVIAIAGIVFMSGEIMIASWLQVASSEELFHISSGHSVVIFLSSLLWPTLIMAVGTVGSLIPVVRTSTGRSPLNVYGYLEGVSIRLFPYTIVLFALLATQILWLPILTKVELKDRRVRQEPTVARGNALRQPVRFHYWLHVILPVAIGVIVSSSRLLVGYPLTGDAHYYLSVFQQMDRYGMGSSFSTDRPLFFLLMYSIRACLSIEAETFLKYVQVILTAALVVSTYLFVSCYLKDERLAILSALLASVSPHVTIGIQYFIIANWLAMILMIIFYAAALKAVGSGSRSWFCCTIALSWLMLGIHFPTWVFATLVLVAYTFISWRMNLSGRGNVRLIGITIGSLAAILLVFAVGFVAPGASTSLQDSWSRAMAILTQMTPLNLGHFFQDDVLLSSYFAYGSYATPLTFTLALYGLYRFYKVHKEPVRLVLSWTAIASLGLIFIPSPEQWRLLYMMPLEILVATALADILRSVGLLGESCIIGVGKKMWLRAVAMAAMLLVAGATLLNSSASLLLIVSGSTVAGWILLYDLSYDQVRQIAAVEIVLLYVLAYAARAFCTLR